MMSNILAQYIQWHFFEVAKNILKAWENFLRFNLNFWSVSLLFKTLFSPWRRYRWSYGRGFNIKRYFEAFIFNLFSRTLGALFRTIFILIGLLVEIFLILGGMVVFLFWLVLPGLLILGLIFGFKILF